MLSLTMLDDFLPQLASFIHSSQSLRDDFVVMVGSWLYTLLKDTEAMDAHISPLRAAVMSDGAISNRHLPSVGPPVKVINVTSFACTQ
jgi:hypothetical protein